MDVLKQDFFLWIITIFCLSHGFCFVFNGICVTFHVKLIPLTSSDVKVQVQNVERRKHFFLWNVTKNYYNNSPLFIFFYIHTQGQACFAISQLISWDSGGPEPEILRFLGLVDTRYTNVATDFYYMYFSEAPFWQTKWGRMINGSGK